jgi:predicted TIM-barrel fold metal-dependent hydrolase
MQIDFHMHMFADKIAEKTIAQLAKTSGMTPCTNGTCSDTLKKMEEWGTRLGVVMTIAVNPKHQKVNNDWAASIQSDKLVPFGSVHPFAEDAIEELHRIKALGLKGVKLHPDYQNFFVDDDRLAPIYETIDQLGLLLMFHAGFDPLSPQVVHGTPKAIGQVVDSHPNLRVIAAHMGGMDRYDQSEEYLVGKNLFLDTSMCARFCPPEQCLRMIRAHGADHILFGTDCPWNSATSELDYLKNLGLTKEELELICERNGAKLLGLDQ